MYIMQLIQSSMSMAHLSRPIPSTSDTEPLSTHWKIWFLNLSVQKSNSYLLKCLKNTLPASDVWTHVFQQPTFLTVSPWIDDKLPWIFLRAFRLSVRLQAKTEGQPLLAKFRLICTTPTRAIAKSCRDIETVHWTHRGIKYILCSCLRNGSVL